jgi:peroxiredoxin Q/BCP
MTASQNFLQAAAMTLQVGDSAPDFTLMSDKNESVTLSQLRGKKVVLYFYPKDDTPGCTKQACDLRDAMPDLTSRDTVVLGISKDSPTQHKRFREKYTLPFSLLADETGDVCQLYGVIDKKSLFGNTFMGIQRSTFLIDENGVLTAVWRKVKVPGHAQKVLNEIES